MSHIQNAKYIVNFNPQQFHPAKPVYVGFASYDQARDICYRLKLLRNGESSQVNIEIPYHGWEANAATESYARYILSLPTVGDFDGFGSFHTQESHAQFCFALQATREDTQTPEQISKAQDLAARLQDAQYLTEEYSGIVHVNNLPLPLPSHLSKRELKRAARQIHKLLGDGSLDWYEGWANSRDCDGPSGLLAFGGYLDNKHNKQCPKNARYGFSSWLWKCAEALGYECTDQDQTSRCEDCNLAIDTGSSTPDYYSFQCECSIVCNKCLNNGIIGTSINQSPHGRLTWKPGDQNDNYLQATEGNLIHVVFESDSAMERFAKDHLICPSELWYRESYGYHGSSILCWFRHENLKDSCLKSYGKPDEWAVYRARINWPEYHNKHDFFPMREFWSFVENKIEESKYPLLSFLAQGKIEEGLLFHCEIELLEQLLLEYNETYREDLRLNDLAHTELQYSEIEEGN